MPPEDDKRCPDAILSVEEQSAMAWLRLGSRSSMGSRHEGVLVELVERLQRAIVGTEVRTAVGANNKIAILERELELVSRSLYEKEAALHIAETQVRFYEVERNQLGDAMRRPGQPHLPVINARALVTFYEEAYAEGVADGERGTVNSIDEQAVDAVANVLRHPDHWPTAPYIDKDDHFNEEAWQEEIRDAALAICAVLRAIGREARFKDSASSPKDDPAPG
jgi:hypothetical protein